MASVNYEKLKRGSGKLAAYLRHCDTDERLWHDHANADIDKDRTPDNITLFEGRGYRGAIDYATQRIKQLDETTNTNKRKDRVEAFALESAAPEGMDGREFMGVMLQALEEQYGADNIIQAYLHLDEIHEYVDNGETKTSRPHVHAFLTPVKDGKLAGAWFSSKSNIMKLNARIHVLCAERGYVYLTGAEARHKSVERLKYESAVEQLKAARLDLQNLQDKIKSLLAEVDSLIVERDAAKQDLRRYIDTYKDVKQQAQMDAFKIRAEAMNETINLERELKAAQADLKYMTRIINSDEALKALYEKQVARDRDAFERVR